MPADSISLIANSGLQFHRVEVPFDRALQRHFKVRFIERFDSLRGRFWLDEVIELPDGGKWARRHQLLEQGVIDHKGRFVQDPDLSGIEFIPEAELQEEGSFDRIFRWFERRWIPLPYFKHNRINEGVFGPTDWVRVWFERSGNDKLQMVLLVDTTTALDEADQAFPMLSDNPNENIHALANEDDQILSFCDPLLGGEWMEQYLSGLVFDAKTEVDRPFLRHVAGYLFLLRFLRHSEQLPQVHLLSDRGAEVNVDLVIDVGNANTCALLLEEPTNQGFSFNSVKKLEVQDLGEPLRRHAEPFSTRLVFHEACFSGGSVHLAHHGKFQWPSLVRTGPEAERLIQDASVALRLNREVRTYNSSPKRYLWDDSPAEMEWEFQQASDDHPPKHVYLKGISEQLNSDGSLCTDGIFGTRSCYSRKSLMTFVFLEVLVQAERQMNAVEFRRLHGNPSKRRRLRRIVITCPTAMLRVEQIALRECAQDAFKLLHNYRGQGRGVEGEAQGIVDVIPTVDDLRITLDNLERRKDWIYDEATSAQLLLIYGMIRHKFDGDAQLFFDMHAKAGTGGRSLTVGSLDVGAGTSDLMICRYTQQTDGSCTITPDPLFWESFGLAGDDLLKEIVQQIILEGSIAQDGDRDCTGVIENHARSLGITDVAKRLNGFFGHDSNNIGYRGRLMRVSFVNQVALPIALRYLEQANREKGVRLTYEELFKDQKPNAELLDYFAKHFGFRFEELVWNISPTKINVLVESVFGKLIRRITELMQAHGCDLVVLSGKPNGLDSMERLFLRHLPVTPNRLVNLNRYWVGRWYPYADNNGFIADPKTVVTVGALVALMGGSLFKLDRFRIDTSKLRTKQVSTADHIGILANGVMRDRIIAPNRNEAIALVHTMPCRFGFTHLDSTDYPARPLCSLRFNEERIREHLSNQREGIGLNDAVEQKKNGLLARLPYRLTLARDPERDKELLAIEQITDRDGDDLPKQFFELKVHTLPDEAGHWLDSGEFTLNIRD